jgi:hypothetical protein
MKNILKNFLLVLFSVIISLYLAETILVIITPSAEKNLTNINEIRIKNAKKLNLKFDLRSPNRAFREMNEKVENLSINYRFTPFVYNLETLKEARKKNQIIPFRGPINMPTLTCAEDLEYKISKNDKFGFKNPNEVYKKPIDLIILGDSYAEGWCYNEKDDVAGLLREKNINSLNFGIAGAGPILSLAVMREYVKNFNPKYLLFFYCESNDLMDLNIEKNNYLLKKYLSNNFSQNLLQNTNQKKIFLKNIDKEIKKMVLSKKDKSIYLKDKKEIFYERLQDSLELSKIKNKIKSLILYGDEKENQELFFKIIREMNNFSNSNNIEFIFVYLPTWERYFVKFSKYNKYISKKEYILNKIESMNIKFLDIDKEFLKEEALENLFPLKYYGHYSRLGYKKVADSILLDLKKRIN